MGAIIGLSLGGIVAQKALIARSYFCRKLILISTLSHALPNEVKQMFISLIAMLQNKELRFDKFADFFAEQMVGKDSLAIFERVKQMPLALGMQGCINHMTACLDYTDFTKQLSQIVVPTLLVHGSNDRSTSLAEMEDIAGQIPNSKLVEIANSGHFVTIDNPTEVNQLIADWLSI